MRDGPIPLLVLNSFCIDIVKAFKKSLPIIPWMDEESAVAAAEKVRPSPIFM